jgi:signal transduction histidine kinase/CheY-like chemotaxis protein
MGNFLDWLLDARGYLPGGDLYRWEPAVLWLNVGSDALIALAYFTISALIYYLVRRRRGDVSLPRVLLLFAAFIVLCALTHAFAIWTVWSPDHRLDGAVKLLTGLVSAGTAATLLVGLPRVLTFHTPAQLQREVDLRTRQLQDSNRHLQQEIDARREIERLLRESEERFRLAMRALHGYVYEYWPVEGRVVRSERFRGVMGLNPADGQNMRWWRARVHPEDTPYLDGILSALEQGAPGASAEYRVRAADDRYLWIWDNCVAVRGADGALQRVVGNVVNISDRREAEAERQELLERERWARQDAERANFAKQEFLATLSHELRTPLSTVLIWAHLLNLKADDPQQVRRAADVITQNARAQSQMISDLLDMSRIDSGKVRLDVQPLDVAQVVNAAVTSVLHAAAAKQIRVTHQIQPLSTTLRGDPSRLQQVLWNLLSNAIKFTPNGGRVLVRVEQVQAHARISVIDSGKGIAPEFLPQVFERFRQADSSHSREHGGLGLGLSIARQLVELHGGRIEVHSEGLGRGTTFCVALPLRSGGASAAAGVPATAGAVPAPGSELRDICVLLVDDQPEALEGLARLLRAAAARVHTAPSAAAALEQLRAHDFDVLLSDIGMPGQDGYELIRAVRASGNAIPAAALTALARAEDRGTALRAGYNVHLAKPVDADELFRTVAALAHSARAVDS